MKLIVKSLIAVLLLCSLTIPPTYGLEDPDPYYKECYGYSGFLAPFERQSKIIEYLTFSADFANFADSKRPKTQKQKLEQKNL